MKHLFYFFGILILVYELYALVHAHDIHKFSKDLKERAKRDGYRYSVNEVGFVLLHGIYVIWAACGLITFQWPLFICLFILSLIPKSNVYIRALDSSATIMILLFMILNAYHLRIDVLSLFL